jgi:hypothetical protein
METILGLGNAGCQLADEFAKYPQYDTYKIDCYTNKAENYLKITERPSHEEYEAKTRLRAAFFKKIKGPVLFIVGGSGDISGASLRILEKIKHLETHILYIRPDLDLLSEKKRMQEKVVFGVLQQYTRSAIFKRMLVIDNKSLETIIGDVPIMGYYDALNQLVVSTIHMINIFDNSEPVMNTFAANTATARICTLGIIDFATGEEKSFFNLDFPREKKYYYAINKEDLESANDLFKTITDQVKERSSEKTKASYGIFSTEYEKNYVYSIAFSSLVQNQEI